MSEIGKWLEGIGLGHYTDAFDINEIDMDLLKQVDDQVLKDIGVSIAGHRLRICSAIAQLGAKPPEETKRAHVSIAKPDPPPVSAERRQLTVMFVDLVGSTARLAVDRITNCFAWLGLEVGADALLGIADPNSACLVIIDPPHL